MNSTVSPASCLSKLKYPPCPFFQAEATYAAASIEETRKGADQDRRIRGGPDEGKRPDERIRLAGARVDDNGVANDHADVVGAAAHEGLAVEQGHGWGAGDLADGAVNVLLVLGQDAGAEEAELAAVSVPRIDDDLL